MIIWMAQMLHLCLRGFVLAREVKECLFDEGVIPARVAGIAVGAGKSLAFPAQFRASVSINKLVAAGIPVTSTGMTNRPVPAGPIIEGRRAS